MGFWTLSIIWHSKEHNVSQTDPFSKMICSLEYQMMENVQEPSNPKCYTPSSVPFRIYLILNALHQLLYRERMAYRLEHMLLERI
jgi:hypothetical protein